MKLLLRISFRWFLSDADFRKSFFFYSPQGYQLLYALEPTIFLEIAKQTNEECLCLPLLPTLTSVKAFCSVLIVKCVNKTWVNILRYFQKSPFPFTSCPFVFCKLNRSDLILKVDSKNIKQMRKISSQINYLKSK